MQKSSIPAKYLLPWAQNDTSKVEVPVTTTDPTRASLSLGFPPLTEQPPEVGGVPPQGEDFNGGMNQISRAIWWMLQGGTFPYDSAFATASQIGGYINSAVIPRADGAGFWLSTADNNLTNPDATDGTAANWVPLNVYGIGTINVTSTAATVYPVTAAFPVLLISGTLTANTVVNLPAWTYQWKIVDNTVRGGFSLTLKTATGAGVVIQTGSQDVRGDGTNIVQNPQSIAAPTQATHAVQVTQVQTDSLNYGVAGGTADALTVTLPAGVTALTDGFPVTVKLAFANATTTPTLAITIGTTAIGALTIVKGANAALAAGDLPGAGAEANFVYSQSLGKLVLMNPAAGVVAIGSPIPGSSSNLKIASLGATNVSSVITASAVVLQNPAGATKTVAGVNLTPSFANTIGQPLALSTGTWTASTWYYVYLWSNGTTLTATYDPSPTAPTAPAGYTGGYYALLGPVLTDSTANKYLMQTVQNGGIGNGRIDYRVTPSTNTANLPILQSGVTGSITTPTYTAVAVGGYVPTPIAKAIGAGLTVIIGAGMLAPNPSYGAYNSATNPPPVVINTPSGGAAATPVWMTLESTNIYVASNTSGCVFCSGFTI